MIELRTHEDRDQAGAPARIVRRATRSDQPHGAAGVRRLQRLAGNRAVATLLGGGDAEGGAVVQRTGDEVRSPVLDVIARGGGRPLEPSLRSTMEQELNANLGSVRVQADARSNEAIGARAYTVGESIVVHPRHLDSASAAGRHLLAHETVHVVQQRAGAVDGTPAPGGIMLSDPSDRFERAAEATARAVSARAAAAASQPGV